MNYTHLTIIFLSLGLISILFIFLGQGFDASGIPPRSVENFLYKQHRSKLIIPQQRMADFDSKNSTVHEDIDTKDTKLHDKDQGGNNKSSKKPQGGNNHKTKETCDVHPAEGVIKGHGPCITQFPRTRFDNSHLNSLK